MKTKIKTSKKPFTADDSSSVQNEVKTVSNKEEKKEKEITPLPDANKNAIDEMAEAFANYGYFFVTSDKVVEKK